MDRFRKLTLLSIFLLSAIFSSTAHVKLEYPKGGEVFGTYKVITIEWTITIDHGDCSWDLLFSEDSGASWDTIAKDISKTTLSYNWGTGNNLTTTGQIRVVQDNVSYGDFWSDSENFTIALTTSLPDASLASDIFTINSPYPNPGSGILNISFDLPWAAYITVEMYDYIGRKLETIRNEEFPEGNHTISWNPANLAPGTYYCKFYIKNQMHIRKIVRTKIP